MEVAAIDPLLAHRDVALSEAWSEAVLGHCFADVELLMQALTHSSAGRPDYQRLEFLGDRVLGCAISAWLYAATGEEEGVLARRLAALVDRDSCASIGRELGVAEHIRMDKSAMNAGVHRSDNALADVTEALIGAIFMDAGWGAADAFVQRAWGERLSARAAAHHDPKSKLQEWAQARGKKLPTYEVVAREGPDHAPRFRIRVVVTGETPLEAMGTSKQEAQMHAAQALLDRVGA